jgi:hypothetical protein
VCLTFPSSVELDGEQSVGVSLGSRAGLWISCALVFSLWMEEGVTLPSAAQNPIRREAGLVAGGSHL